MAFDRILILGGYGETGRRLARHLLSQTEAHIVIAGRDGARAEALASELNSAHPGGRAYGIALEAASEHQFRNAFSFSRLLINAGPALPVNVIKGLAEAVLDAGADWIDVQLDVRQASTLAGFKPRIEAEGRCFVTQGGFHPGVPGLLVRWAAERVDRLDSVEIASFLNQRKGLPYTSGVDELIEMFKDYRAHIWENGKWMAVTGSKKSDYMPFDFAFDIGRQWVVPMDLEEMRSLPGMFPSLRRAGFWVGGFNWVTNLIISPLIMLGLKFAPRIRHRTWGKLMCWSTRAFARPPYGTLLQINCEAEREGRRVRPWLALFHDDGYELTAIPVVATVLQMRDGTAHRPGLHRQAMLPDPDRFLADIETMGVRIEQGGLEE